MIELNGANFGWPDSPQALTDISFTLRAGEKAVLLGANGCGKSTLLKMLNGLVFPTAGTYRYCDEEVSPGQMREKSWARRFRQEVVLLFQHPDAMLFNPTVREEIAYGPRKLGWPDADARVARWAKELRLQAVLDKAPFTLSGGEKQKVALAAILALDPKVILLDEPSASLDPKATGWLVDFLLDTEATVVVSTHNLSMAAEFGERCLIIGEDRRLVYDGPVDTALGDLALLERVNLAHVHRHRHGSREHAHVHKHE
ncbi:MAG: cobalt/nickel transport system ATP-binding protein [Burkholderiales bacterium]